MASFLHRIRSGSNWQCHLSATDAVAPGERKARGVSTGLGPGAGLLDLRGGVQFVADGDEEVVSI